MAKKMSPSHYYMSTHAFQSYHPNLINSVCDSFVSSPCLNYRQGSRVYDRVENAGKIAHKPVCCAAVLCISRCALHSVREEERLAGCA